MVQILLVHGNSRIQAGVGGDGAPSRCVLRGNTSVIPIAYATG